MTCWYIINSWSSLVDRMKVHEIHWTISYATPSANANNQCIFVFGWNKGTLTGVVICSALELFLVKRKVKGPSWLSISKFSSCPAPQRVSLWNMGILYCLIMNACSFNCNCLVYSLTGELVQIWDHCGLSKRYTSFIILKACSRGSSSDCHCYKLENCFQQKAGCEWNCICIGCLLSQGKG